MQPIEKSKNTFLWIAEKEERKKGGAEDNVGSKKKTTLASNPIRQQRGGKRNY